MKAETIVSEYLQSGKTRMVQLASSMGDKPWACTVYFAVDDALSLYWVSEPTSRHSQNFLANPLAAIAIAHDQQPPTNTHQGLQAEGTVLQLVGSEKSVALDLYAQQLKSDSEWIQSIKDNASTYEIYKFTPMRFVLFDDINFPDNPQNVVELSK